MSELKAFVCYRRADSFNISSNIEIDGDPFLKKVESALIRAGFSDVFIDSDTKKGIAVTSNYEQTCFRAIEGCDIFVVLIGKNWLDLLERKGDGKTHDAVAREIRMALSYEKTILPILVDGSEMPRPEQLPQQIRALHFPNAIHCESTDSTEEISRKIYSATDDVSDTGLFKKRWSFIYMVGCIFVYFFCALWIHAKGMNEYGADSWKGIIKMWGGFFIWPALLLPFVLFALYRPLTTISEYLVRSFRVPNYRRAGVYMFPILVGTVLAVAAWFVEVMDPHQVPWTISPAIGGATCQKLENTSNKETASTPETQQKIIDLSLLTNYDKNNALERIYAAKDQSPFWLKDKCWPNLLFYLTVPIYDGSADDQYLQERKINQKAFSQILLDEYRITNGVSLSETSTAYRISFAALMWIGLMGVILAGFFMAAKIKDPRSDEERSLPVDDAFMCLTYSLVTLMTWIPFRMNTRYIKHLYACADYPNCPIDITHYMPDLLFGAMLLVGYLFTTVGLLARFRRVALAFFGSAMVLFCISGTVVVYFYSHQFARLFEYWQFYVLLFIPCVALVFALWLVFNPNDVHYKDFRKDVM